MTAPPSVLVLGIGNTLLADDGIGVLIAQEVAKRFQGDARITVCDGGTVGLALLPEIEDHEHLIVLDSARTGADPGAVCVVEDEAMDRLLAGIKKTAHEVQVSDLLAAAHLTGRMPKHRALVGVEPVEIGWGETPSAPVAAAIPTAMAAVDRLLEGWLDA